MKIGINTLFFRYPASGSGQYLLHLLQALAEVDQQNRYVLLGPEPSLQGNSTPDTFPYQVAPIPGFATRNASIEKLVWEQFTAPAAAYTQLIARAAHKATLIITISQHAKQDMIDALKLPAERIRVIYEAAGDEYQPVTDPATLAKARARYGLNERYILYIGGLDQRKNVPQLVRAFAYLSRQMHDPGLQLLIAGNPDKQSGPLFPDPRPVAADLGMTGQIIYRFIEEEDKPALYSGASVFVFPSLYEGFGLTPLEAMSCGAPVICSNRTSLPEVVGDAAISMDPEDTHKMVEAMHSVLSNSDLRADLRARSLQRAAQFNWRKTATETIDAYEEAYKRSRKK